MCAAAGGLHAGLRCADLHCLLCTPASAPAADRASTYPGAGQHNLTSLRGVMTSSKDPIHDPQQFPFAHIPCNELPAKPRWVSSSSSMLHHDHWTWPRCFVSGCKLLLLRCLQSWDGQGVQTRHARMGVPHKHLTQRIIIVSTQHAMHH